MTGIRRLLSRNIVLLNIRSRTLGGNKIKIREIQTLLNATTHLALLLFII